MREAEGEKVWRAALYLRLSKEDGFMEEGSIRSQRELLRAFVRERPGFLEAGVYADEGFSGGSFDRPQFKRMMGDLRAGRADCVIVKDLSRLGRDYIGTGRLIQRVFPAMGVRFIALTDRYDSLTADERDKDFLVPVKNLINDAYCRDISQKVRSRQRLKREQGQFIGAFAPYGFRRDRHDRHRLAPDGETAWVVEWIFKRRLTGASILGISKELEQMGILAPSEYRRLKGERYATGFLMGPAARWSPGEVGRILADETYIGVLAQGRSEKAGYKADVRREKPKEQWARREGAHEAVVSRRDFELAGRLQGVEIKGGGEGNPFAGFVRCGDCGGGMIRRRSGRRRGLICAAGNRGKGCGWNWVGEEMVAGVLAAAVGMGVWGWGEGGEERRDMAEPGLLGKVSGVEVPGLQGRETNRRLHGPADKLPPDIFASEKSRTRNQPDLPDQRRGTETIKEEGCPENRGGNPVVFPVCRKKESRGPSMSGLAGTMYGKKMRLSAPKNPGQNPILHSRRPNSPWLPESRPPMRFKPRNYTAAAQGNAPAPPPSRKREAALRRQREFTGREIRRCRRLRASVQRDCQGGRLTPQEGRELERLYTGREEFFAEAFKRQGQLLKGFREGKFCGDIGQLRCFLLAFVREALVYREKRILVRLDFANPFLGLFKEEE